jgi:N-methylhydantoinase A
VATLALGRQQATPAALQPVLDDLEARARRQLAAERVPPERIVLDWALDLRYEGQSYELTVPLTRAGPALEAADLEAVVRRFHELHWRIYAYGEPSEPVEFVSLRLAAIGKVPPVQLARRRSTSRRPAPKGQRPVFYPAAGRFVPSRVYERSALETGQRFTGPCLIEETTATTVVPPGCSGVVDAYGSLLIAVGATVPARPPRRSRAAQNGHRRKPDEVRA